MSNFNRREFLTATVGLAALPLAAESAEVTPKIPRRKLGKTGIEVTILGLGGGSQFLKATANDDEAAELVSTAIDGGINYLDSAFGYGDGESLRRYGLVVGKLGSRRKELVLTSKTGQRLRDGALKEFEVALKNLGTDYLDVMQIHDIHPDEDLDRILSKDGVYRALLELKAQKVVRAVGITGHASVLRMKGLLERMEEIDTVLCPVNPALDSRHYIPKREPGNPEGLFEETLLPYARSRGLGIIAMKTTAQGELIGEGPGKADVPTLIRYALSEPGVCVAIVGPGSLSNLKKNLETARSFKPLKAEERKKLIASVAHADRRFAYMGELYRDCC